MSVPVDLVKIFLNLHLIPTEIQISLFVLKKNRNLFLLLFLSSYCKRRSIWNLWT